jgi:serine protease Do
MGNSKCLLLLALALIIGSTGCQNSLLGGRFDTQSDARRWGVDWQQLDTSFWNSMKDSGDITSYQAYLEQFPSGSYVNLARERINLVRESVRSEVNGWKANTTEKIAKKTPPPSPSAAEVENERLQKRIAELENQSKPKQVAKRPPPKKSPPPKSATSGSGFFISKLGHVLTNQHVVDDCKKVTVGDDTRKQVTANVLETDRRNDLALLKISSMKMASAETRSLIRKLGINLVPLASDGLLRSEGVELGEDVLVAGYPYGEIFSNSIKVTKGIVSANRGLGDDTGQFQIDAAVQPGNSGGPIYDGNGNIVGVVVSQLNKMKFAKEIGSMPENVNFGIKASTVRQFLTASGLTTKWSKRSKGISTKELAKIAKNQTVMVVCHR